MVKLYLFTFSDCCSFMFVRLYGHFFSTATISLKSSLPLKKHDKEFL